MIPLGARIINNSGLTLEATADLIYTDIRSRIKAREDERDVTRLKPRW